MPNYSPIEWNEFAIADLADSEVEGVKLRRYYRQTDPNRLKLLSALKGLKIDQGKSVGPFVARRVINSVRNFALDIARKHKIQIATRVLPTEGGYYLQIVRMEPKKQA